MTPKWLAVGRLESTVAPFGSPWLPFWQCFFASNLLSLSTSHFYQFLDNVDLKFDQKSSRNIKKSPRIVLGEPLGIKNLILADLQYLPSENHVFQDPQGPEINENMMKSSKKQTADAPN